MAITKKWKGFDVQEKPDQAAISAESFIMENNKFGKVWDQLDKENGKTGMLDVMEAHQFVKKFIDAPTQVQEAQTEDGEAAF